MGVAAGDHLRRDDDHLQGVVEAGGLPGGRLRGPRDPSGRPGPVPAAQWPGARHRDRCGVDARRDPRRRRQRPDRTRAGAARGAPGRPRAGLPAPPGPSRRSRCAARGRRCRRAGTPHRPRSAPGGPPLHGRAAGLGRDGPGRPARTPGSRARLPHLRDDRRAQGGRRDAVGALGEDAVLRRRLPPGPRGRPPAVPADRPRLRLEARAARAAARRAPGAHGPVLPRAGPRGPAA